MPSPQTNTFDSYKVTKTVYTFFFFFNLQATCNIIDWLHSKNDKHYFIWYISYVNYKAFSS